MSQRNLIRRALAKIGYTGRITSATATNGTAIDRQGYDEALIVVTTGTFNASSATADIKIQMDTASGFSSPTDITGAAFTQLDEDADNVLRVMRIDLKGAERYIRPVITTAGTLTSLDVAVTVLLGDGVRTLSDGIGYTTTEWDGEVSA